MPFVPVPNPAEAVLRYIWNGQQCANTLGFSAVGGWNPITLTNLCAALQAWWESALQPHLSNTIALVEVSATDLTTATSPAIDLPVSPPSAGAALVNSVPNNVSIAVTFKTASRGRSFRGRNYVAGTPGTAVANNTYDGVFLANITNAYDQILSDVTAEVDADWVVISRFSGVDASGKPIPRVTGIATKIISVGLFDNVVDSQRRRLPGRGV